MSLQIAAKVVAENNLYCLKAYVAAILIVRPYTKYNKSYRQAAKEILSN